MGAKSTTTSNHPSTPVGTCIPDNTHPFYIVKLFFLDMGHTRNHGNEYISEYVSKFVIAFFGTKI